MRVVTKSIRLQTTEEGDMLDVTHKTQQVVQEAGLKDGIVVLFVPGSTGALTTIEYEPGLLQDFPDALERLAPKNIQYEHETRWHDGNGHSHIRASLLGPSLTVPFSNGRLTLGQWQQIAFVELDVRPRSRELLLRLMGE
jgi:secondary thiamine-phosphate synthase enzyme